MSTPGRNLRLALRALKARPALSIVRIATLAVVVAAASAVLLVANATLMRPLPFRNPDRLVRIYMQPPGTSSFDQANPLHPLEFVQLRERRLNALVGVEGLWARDRAVAGDGDPESLPTAAISAGLFDLVGATPLVGRTFSDDEARDARRVVVLSNGFWARRYGQDPSVVGRTYLIIDREPYEVIGIMREGFQPPFVASELYTPLEIRDGNLINPGATFVQTIGMLRPGASVEQAQEELQSIVSSLTEEQDTRLKGWLNGVRDLRDAQYGSQARPLVLLLAAVAALALIAIANLANLTLADILHRRSELAVRSALGASRIALLWPEVVQSVSIAAAGGGAGLVAAQAFVPALIALDPSSALAKETLAADWRVVTTVAVIAFAVIATAALLPAYRFAGRDVSAALADASRRTAGGQGHERLRAWLVATQTALALILVSSGALLAGAFNRTSRTNPGFDPDHVLTAQLRLAQNAYPTPERRTAFVDGVLARVRTIPGVVDASTTMNEFVPGFTFQTLIHIEGKPTPTGEAHTVLFRRISPGYFRILRIPERAGRTFDSRDGAAGLPAAVVSQSFAERFWPGEEALGKRLRRNAAAAPWLTVIGVVGDVHDVGYGQSPDAVLYTTYAQNNVPNSPIGLVVRTVGDPREYGAAIKTAVREIDPAQPLASIATLDRFLADSLGPQRFRSVLLAIFAGVGLLLAAVGIYAVTARSVAERTREVGVRLALGGQPRRVWWTVARRTIVAVAAGLGAGGVAATGAAALLASIFPEVDATSPLYAAPAIVLLTLAGCGTALLAAHRVTRIDPIRAIRQS